MKPEVLQLSPILIPEVREGLEALFTVHRYYEQADKEAYVSAPRVAVTWIPRSRA